ncbi:MAG: acyltransferase [Lachnospiraceae bacterium]|nr:acyltransferase [Lachnospiraceae bacterium]
MKRIYSLDVLKFIMAVLLVFHHYQQSTGMRGRINFYEGTIYWGCLVEMFFIISGFLIAPTVKGMLKTGFKNYILNKLIRIYPMAMLSVLFKTVLGFVYVCLFGHWSGGVRLTLWNVWNNLWLMFSGGAVNTADGINNPLWFLCVLIYCYVLLYFAVWLSDRLSVSEVYSFAVISIVGFAALQYEVKAPFLNEYSGRGYAAFFLGMLLYYIWNSVSRKLLTAYSVVCLAVCIAVYFGAYSLFAANMRDVMTYIVFPALLFLTLAADRFTDERIMGRLEPGAVAFEVYVWQSCILGLWNIIADATGIIDTGKYYQMFIMTAVLIVFSAIMYRFAEKKITKTLRAKLIKNT